MGASEVPLLETPPARSPSAEFGLACINLFATTVGAGILSVPISFGDCGSTLTAIMLLVGFGVLSAASLLFIEGAATRMGATSYLALGERCYGRSGSTAVLVSLLGLLTGAAVQVLIIVADLVEMLSKKYAPFVPSRHLIFIVVVVAECVLCLPRELHQLRVTSSLSVMAILFTCCCIVGLALCGGDNDAEAPITDSDTPPPSPGANGWLLAMPIFSLAYCAQFNVLDISQALPKAHRAAMLPRVVYFAMSGAFVCYAGVGVACYWLLGADTLLYPNVLTAFGDVPVVALGSAAIACVNFLKLPLVLLPLRALLLEQCGVTPPPEGLAHVALTAVLLGALGLLGTLANNLALAFQLAGSTAGVLVCFVLPGALHFAALRHEAALGDSRAASLGTGGVLAAARWAVPRTANEAAAVGMLLVGIVSGVLSLWATLKTASHSA